MLLAQYNYKVNKPLMDPIVHDDFTRFCIVGLLLPLSLYILYRIMRYYDG